MKNAFLAVIALAVLGILGAPAPSQAADEGGGTATAGADQQPKPMQTKEECYSCHTLDGLAAANPRITGAERDKLRHLLIDQAAYDQSTHTGLFCKECHGDGVTNYPHTGDFRGPVDTCPACHRRFKSTVVPEFKQSVHAQRHPDQFTCYSCHDPHNVRKAASLGTERNLAHRDNSMCLGCHNSDAQYAKYTSSKRPDLLQVHSWQPNPQLHWTAVRCIDCHTPEKAGGAIGHNVLPKEQAQRLCVDCHSTSASLLTRLYRGEIGRERVNAAGFINAYILNQAYVLGVTRNTYLDLASLILLVILAGGLAGHGLLRGIGHMARKGRK